MADDGMLSISFPTADSATIKMKDQAPITVTVHGGLMRFKQPVDEKTGRFHQIGWRYDSGVRQGIFSTVLAMDSGDTYDLDEDDEAGEVLTPYQKELLTDAIEHQTWTSDEESDAEYVSSSE